MIVISATSAGLRQAGSSFALSGSRSRNAGPREKMTELGACLRGGMNQVVLGLRVQPTLRIAGEPVTEAYSSTEWARASSRSGGVDGGGYGRKCGKRCVKERAGHSQARWSQEADTYTYEERDMKRTARTLLSLPWVVLLAACATPDLKPFADRTASLAATVNVERAAILERFEMVSDLTEEYREEDKAEWQEAKRRYRASSKVVSDLLGEAVQYSTTLADLAEASESGGEAVDSLLGTINGFASVASISGLSADLAKTTAGQVLHKVGEAWTRIKGQRSLRDAVTVVSGSDGAVRVLARGIAEIYGCKEIGACDDSQSKLLDALNEQERLMRRREAGRQRIGLFEEIGGPDRLESYYAAIRQKLPEDTAERGFCVNPNGGMDDPHCVPGENLQSIAALHAILAVLESNYLVWREKVREAEAWKRTRQVKAHAIVAAVEAWAAEHDKLADVLQRCSGFRALGSSCGGLSAANLRTAVEQITLMVGES